MSTDASLYTPFSIYAFGDLTPSLHSLSLYLMALPVQSPHSITLVDKVDTVGYVPRLMKNVRWLTAVTITLTLLLALLVLTDGLPWLRGPAPESEVWHWVFGRRPFSRWWGVGLAGSGFIGVLVYWLFVGSGERSGQTGLVLLGLMVASVGMQWGLVYADRGAAYAELIDRTLAVQTNGYFWTAAHVTNMGETLRTYPELMPTFESDHLRTHPPALLLANWRTLRFFEKQESLTNELAPTVWAQRCTDVWLLDNPPYVAAGLALWALLPMVMAATAVIPAYLLGLQLAPHSAQARLGVGLTAVIPALLIFTPTPDQISAVLALWTVWLFVVGLRSERLAFYFLSGLLLSGMSFVSLGNGTLGVVLGVVWLFQHKGTKSTKGLKKGIWGLVLFGVGAALVWLVYWLGWGVPPWQIAQVGLAEHEALVLENRAYATWAFFNLMDLLTFLGLPILVGFVWLLVSKRPSIPPLLRHLALATAVTLLILNFSGSTRGEVGRIWLFFFPIMAVCAGVYLSQRLTPRLAIGLVMAQLLLALAVGLAWRPIEATIVVAERPSMPQATPENLLNVPFEHGITLTGFTLVEEEESLDLTLFWESKGGVERPYTVFNHLIDPTGALATQADGWSVNGQWPTTCWQAGETIVDQFTIPIPEDSTGPYQLMTGLYDGRDNTRLIIPTSGDTAVTLTTIEQK